MKSFTVVALLVVALFALGSTREIPSKFADKDFLVKQKFLLEILQHVYQDDVFVTKYDNSFYDYKPWEHKDDYNHYEMLEDFFELWHHKPMLDDEIFSVIYDRHNQYVLGLARVFYFAKDWNSFQHAVFWARLHVNKQLFVYVLTTVAVARDDLVGIVLPSIYEVQPWYFFDADTLESAEFYKMHGFHKVKKLDDIYNVVIKTNYTNLYGDVKYDQSMAYFMEDIGMNAFYYYYNIDYPYWTKGRDQKMLNNDRRGELYLFTHWQLLARYYMERLSNDLGDIPQFDVYTTAYDGYYPNLHYQRGVAFPTRDDGHEFYYGENVEYSRLIDLYTMRIMDWIHKNTEHTTDVINKLGNIIQGNMDSVDETFFGSLDRLYRSVVNEGRPYGKYYETLPTTMMHYETSLRDPIFYEIYKELVHIYWHLMDQFPEYTKEDYNFEGVKINKVSMPDGLHTFFEYFDADISNAVDVEVPSDAGLDNFVQFGRNSHHDGNSFVIKARQYRLNHKAFDFQLDVVSDKAQKAVVKVFLGPKYDVNGHEINVEDNYKNFFELDHFLVDLVAGENVIKRNSNDYTWWVNDRTTYLELYQKVMDATNTDYKFPLDQTEAHCGVPRRMMLPKGKHGGLRVQFFYMVYPYHKPAVEQYSTYDPVVSCGVTSGARYVDSMPFGFPFNRPVVHDYYFDVDNFKFHDVTIFHKTDTTNVV